MRAAKRIVARRNVAVDPSLVIEADTSSDAPAKGARLKDCPPDGLAAPRIVSTKFFRSRFSHAETLRTCPICNETTSNDRRLNSAG